MGELPWGSGTVKPAVGIGRVRLIDCPKQGQKMAHSRQDLCKSPLNCSGRHEPLYGASLTRQQCRPLPACARGLRDRHRRCWWSCGSALTRRDRKWPPARLASRRQRSKSCPARDNRSTLPFRCALPTCQRESRCHRGRKHLRWHHSTRPSCTRPRSRGRTRSCR